MTVRWGAGLLVVCCCFLVLRLFTAVNHFFGGCCCSNFFVSQCSTVPVCRWAYGPDRPVGGLWLNRQAADFWSGSGSAGLVSMQFSTRPTEAMVTLQVCTYYTTHL